MYARGYPQARDRAQRLRSFGGRISIVNPVDVVRAHGGAARWRTLTREGVSRRGLSRAVGAGDLVHVGYGTYALPGTSADIIAATRVGGFLSHESAAELWRLDVRTPPRRPHIVVPDDRTATPVPGMPVRIHRIGRERLATTNMPWPVTTVERTLEDCARTLPFADALVVLDSALRNQEIDEAGLVEIANSLRGPGSALARRALRAADRRSASIGETLLRAAAIEADLPDPEPQLEITLPDGSSAYLDLGWRSYRGREVKLGAEFDGHTGHGKVDFVKDRRRHNKLLLAGWQRLIFTTPDVEHAYDAIGRQMREALELRWRTAPSIREW